MDFLFIVRILVFIMEYPHVWPEESINVPAGVQFLHDIDEFVKDVENYSFFGNSFMKRELKEKVMEERRMACRSVFEKE